MGNDSSGSGGKIDDINGYEPSVQIPDDDLKLLDSMITLRNIDRGIKRERFFICICIYITIL